MAMISIVSGVEDAFERYKMPRIEIKVEGKGNGIKTVLPNIVAVADALARPPEYITKFFGFELGSITKVLDNNRHIVNGEHAADTLQRQLDTFIKKFVLCVACNNPETELDVNQGAVTRVCQACGMLSPVDQRQKLVTFILKNPLLLKKKPVFDVASQTRKQARRPKGGVEALTKRAEGLDLEDEGGTEGTSKFTAFAEYLGQHPELSANQVFDEAAKRGIETRSKTVLALVPIVFNTDKLLDRVSEYQPVLAKFGSTDRHQKALLGGVEKLMQANPALLSKASMLLQHLYASDLLDEALVAKWGAQPTDRYVDKPFAKTLRGHAKPFFDWLATAEEEGSEASS